MNLQSRQHIKDLLFPSECAGHGKLIKLTS